MKAMANAPVVFAAACAVCRRLMFTGDGVPIAFMIKTLPNAAAPDMAKKTAAKMDGKMLKTFICQTCAQAATANGGGSGDDKALGLAIDGDKLLVIVGGDAAN